MTFKWKKLYRKIQVKNLKQTEPDVRGLGLDLVKDSLEFQPRNSIAMTKNNFLFIARSTVDTFGIKIDNKWLNS